MELSRLPPRVLVALVLTVAALAVLGGRALLSGEGNDGDAGGAASTTTSSTSTSQPPVELTTTSVEVRSEWFPKQTSRYSERESVVSLTTVPTTSSTVPADDATDSPGSRSGAGGSGTG